MYTDLRVSWAEPITHENLIHQTKVQEIFYTRIFIYIFFVLLTIRFVLLSEYSYLSILYFVFLLVFYPYFIKPWEIILTNKRLILRHQYWNVGRFSTLISFNLDTLDTQQIAPRFKLIPVTIGFTILTVYSISLLEFYLTSRLPTPLLIRIAFLIFGSIRIVNNISEVQTDLVDLLLSPFIHEALFFSLISMIPAVALIIFGLPRRQQMLLSTTGGHRLSLSTGIHQKLTSLLFAVGRKHRVKEITSDWEWDLPLLDDEEVKAEAQIGLIERKAQILGLVSLILFIDSFDQFLTILLHPNGQNLILFVLKVLDLLFIWFALVFSKKYRRLIATNHRLLYQEEMREISGLWGKRIYQYREFPYEFIKGFTYSNFSAIQINAVLGILVLIFGLSVISDSYEFQGLTILIVFFIIGYILLNYRNFTSLKFSSIGGGTMELFYKLPVFMVNISHRLENRERIYNRFFPNILGENDVADLCNSVRGVKNPKENLESEHEINVDAFISKEEVEFGRWKKVGQFRFSKGSVFLGMIISFIIMLTLYSKFEAGLHVIFIVFAILVILFQGLYLLVQRYRTLIILKNRLFFIDEISPRRVAQAFGRLPERSIQELSLEYLLASQFRFTFGRKIGEFVKYLFIIFISVYTISGSESIVQYSDGLTRDFIILLAGLALVGTVVPASKSFFENLPKYSLRIFTRFGVIVIPYMRDLDEISLAINNARDNK
ncbi:MAG: hypothetical protein GPJ54_02085 [Candidatus Heimdallarchaeota archaeon]|nr:hypothetical protein [Candidatus Heimdallarchaeota archaeon]